MNTQSNGNDGSDVPLGELLQSRGIDLVACKKEKEEQRTQFEAEKEAWQNEKKQLMEKLSEAQTTVDTLKKESEKAAIKHKQEMEKLKKNHEAKEKVSSSKITELAKTIDELRKTIELKDKMISVHEACDAVVDSELEKIGNISCERAKLMEEFYATSMKESVKENPAEKEELVTAEEMDEGSKRKRKAEEELTE